MPSSRSSKPRLTPPALLAPEVVVGELLTVRDFIRYATTVFTATELYFGHGTTTPLDEAVYLVLETLHLPIDDVGPFMEARLTTPERHTLADRITERVISRKPAAYLTGRAYIQGLPFRVDERVIVPRSYIGEMLFSDLFSGGGGEVSGLFSGNEPQNPVSLIGDPQSIDSVLDLCTGSGCLAILAGQVFPNASITAVDLSPDALAVAAQNVSDYGLEDRVSLVRGDLFAGIVGRRFDLIITNPPYVDADAMTHLPPEYRHEPTMALAGGRDGLDIVRRILYEAGHFLTANGGLICEIGMGRHILEAEYPDIEFIWLDSEDSQGEVFWLNATQLERV